MFDEMQVEVRTAPLQLFPPSELLEEITAFLNERVNFMIKSYSIIDHDRWNNQSTYNFWSNVLTDTLKVPVKVKTIFKDMNVNFFKERIIFGIEMTQEIVDAYENRYQNELLNLIDNLG
jgi:hypothetical protein